MGFEEATERQLQKMLELLPWINEENLNYFYGWTLAIPGTEAHPYAISPEEVVNWMEVVRDTILFDTLGNRSTAGP